MCGFVGQIILKGLNLASIESRLARALERLRNRGPDSTATWLGNCCALGNTRLAVQDLTSAGSLPMHAHGFSLAYNGEIYNFLELQSELKDLGYKFKSRSDSEVLLAGWHAWGEDLLPRLAGMFAFAIWDCAKSELILVRDRYGKKPLLYKNEDRSFSFSSELAALEALSDSSPEIDTSALRLLFTLRYIPEPLSISKNVAKLPGGHLLRYNRDGIHIKRWYIGAQEALSKYGNWQIASRDLVDKFDNAVSCRLISDVPVGVFLSGGIDSALVASSMVRSIDKVRSFTVGFENSTKYYEERPAAEKVAKYLNTEHTSIEISPLDSQSALTDIFVGLDEPFADSSAIPMYLLAREARKHVTVALSGDGADEIFGGYRKYQGELLASKYQSIPNILRRGLIEPLVNRFPESKDNPLSEKIRRLRRFVAHAGKDSIGRQIGWMELLNANERSEFFLEGEETFLLEKMLAKFRDESADKDPINAMLYADMHIGLPGDMLVKIDRMSMANSLEVRSPFLDHRLIECALAMPSSFKLVPGKGKYILRKAFADRLPMEVFSLPKKGFEIPIASWLTGPLKDLTLRSIDKDLLAKQNIFNSDLPRKWYEDLKENRVDTSEKLWTLIAFQAWCENFYPSWAI